MNISWTSTNQHHYGLYLMNGSTQIADINVPNVSSATNYSWQIPGSINGYTLNGSNYKLKLVVWNTGISGNEQHVYDFSNYFSITPQQTNQPPNDPYIYSYTSNIYVGQSVNINVRSGSDPDGDQTKIQVTATHSNFTDSNPYVSSWNTSVPPIPFPLHLPKKVHKPYMPLHMIVMEPEVV